MLGPLSQEQTPPPQMTDLRSMYGIVVTPLRGQAAMN
jgi:hypothetical protein